MCAIRHTGKEKRKSFDMAELMQFADCTRVVYILIHLLVSLLPSAVYSIDASIVIPRPIFPSKHKTTSGVIASSRLICIRLSFPLCLECPLGQSNPRCDGKINFSLAPGKSLLRRSAIIAKHSSRRMTLSFAFDHVSWININSKRSSRRGELSPPQLIKVRKIERSVIILASPFHRATREV